jgi:outer membrane protein, heavy metal efflux system
MKALLTLGLVALLAAGATPRALAAEPAAGPLTLDDALRLARERSPQVVAAAARLDEARGALATARAWAHNPEFEFETTRRRTADSTGDDRAWRVDQRLDLAGRGPRIGAARGDLEAATWDRLDAAAGAGAAAARAWLVAAHLAAQRALAAEGAAVQERLHAAATARFAAGEVSALDVSLATVALARARAAAATSRADELDALAALAAQLDWQGDGLPEVAGAVAWPDPPALASAREAALAQPALNALAAAVTAAERRRAVAGALAWPELGIFGGAGREDDADLTQLGVTLTVPLFARGQGERRQAAAAARLAAAELAAARAARLAQVTAAWQRHAELKAAVTASDEAVAAALEASVRLTEAAYRLGELTLDEALLAQREQVDARRDLNDLRLSAALAALDVAYLAALPPLHEGDAR